MKNLRVDYYNRTFSHIYVEKGIWNHPRTQTVLGHFKEAKVVLIDHYKDMFCRSRQDYKKQHFSQNLILAAKHGNLIYEGAPVCQNFGNAYFYYTSCMMNCVYDCEYCYLKGMYPSGNMVVFVNLEDVFEETKGLLLSHPVYLCVSYDTDLLAMEGLMGYVKEWTAFVKEQNARGWNKLNIEIRTKSANREFIKQTEVQREIIYAFTLSPERIIEAYEHGTPSLSQRLTCAAEAVAAGFSVRLCFDPMIYCTGWEEEYEKMLHQVFDTIDMKKILDVSVGTFRVSQDYLKKMRKCEPDSAVVQFPYENEGGVYHYPAVLMGRMENFLVERLKEKLPEEKIFRWEKQAE